MPLQNDLLLKAAQGLQTERTPVWLMRQAGRVLPEYRAVRKSLSGFRELVETPERAAEVTVQPIDILGVDAAIIFSDILVVPDAMGLSYEMIEKEGPKFSKPVQTRADVKKLKIADPTVLNYVYDALSMAKKELNGRVPLIGFAGAPWTVFAYMVEGEGNKTFSKARAMLYTEPKLAHELMDMIAKTTIGYLKAQIASGADLVQIFDSWAGLLPPTHYSEFSLRYIARICDAIKEAPITVFAKGAWFALKEMGSLSCSVIGLDWNTNASYAKEIMPDKALQGNLDPCVLYGSHEDIRMETKKMLDQFAGRPHIANLGHGVYSDADLEKVKYFVQVVKELSAHCPDD